MEREMDGAPEEVIYRVGLWFDKCLLSSNHFPDTALCTEKAGNKDPLHGVYILAAETDNKQIYVICQLVISILEK